MNNLGQEAKLGFKYTIEHVRDGQVIDTFEADNLIPTEGLNYLANVAMKGASPISSWYVALYEGNYTPVAGVTAATVVAAATECTAYSASTRVAWTGGSVSAGAVDNSAARAEFTMNASKLVYGGFLISSDGKGSGLGTLLSIVRFPTARQLESGDLFRVTAGLSLLSI